MVESPSGELPMTLLTDFDSWGGRSATIPTAPTATVLKLRDAAQEIFGVGFLRASTWHRWVATETGISWRKHKNQQQIERGWVLECIWALRKEEELNQIMQMSAGSSKSRYFIFFLAICFSEDTVVSEHRTTTPAYTFWLRATRVGTRCWQRKYRISFLRGTESITCKTQRWRLTHAGLWFPRTKKMNRNCLQFPRGLFCYFVVSHHCSDVHSLLPECSKV